MSSFLQAPCNGSSGIDEVKICLPMLLSQSYRHYFPKQLFIADVPRVLWFRYCAQSWKLGWEDRKFHPCVVDSFLYFSPMLLRPIFYIHCNEWCDITWSSCNIDHVDILWAAGFKSMLASKILESCSPTSIKMVTAMWNDKKIRDTGK